MWTSKIPGLYSVDEISVAKSVVGIGSAPKYTSYFIGSSSGSEHSHFNTTDNSVLVAPSEGIGLSGYLGGSFTSRAQEISMENDNVTTSNRRNFFINSTPSTLYHIIQN